MSPAFAQSPSVPAGREGDAQGNIQAFSRHAPLLIGRWSSGTSASCAARWNDISTDRLNVIFDDQRGGHDVERVIEVRPNGFVTQSVVASSEPIGTLWNYEFISPDQIRVRNLRTQATFVVRRCPRPSDTNEVAGTRNNPAIASTQSAAPFTVGPSFNCSTSAAQREPLARMVCSDASLARLDLSYVQAYQALRHQVGEAGQQDLRREANEAQQTVLARCGIPSVPAGARQAASLPLGWSPASARPCVVNLYTDQRGTWLARLLPMARQEADRPLERHIALQRGLVELGFLSAGTTTDGNYGPVTRTAIAAWQRTHGLVDNGFLGESDASLLDRDVEKARWVQQQEARAREEEERRRRLQAERDEADARARVLAEQRAQAEAERIRQLAQEREEAEARARATAEARAREEAEQARRAAAEREDAAQRLAAALGSDENTGVVVVSLGRDGGRLRRTLRGDLVAIDPVRPPVTCVIIGPETPGGFADFVRERQGALLAGSPGALRAMCPSGDDVLKQDVILLHQVAASRATTPTLVALTRALSDDRVEVIGRVTAAEYRAELDRRRREAEDEAARLAALSTAVRQEALDGTLAEWGAVTIAGRTPTTACVVGAPSGAWSDVVGTMLPQTVAASIRTASGDTDADRQFGRLLSGDCGVLLARGRDLGDVIRGLIANRREVAVLPVRVPQAAVERALAASTSVKAPDTVAVAPVLPPPGPSRPTVEQPAIAQPLSSRASGTERRANTPSEQAALVAAVEAARQQYGSAANDMAKGAARPARASAICAVLPSRSINGWIGRVAHLSTNGDGKGVLEVEVGSDVLFKTWNNTLSDISDNTLIEPSSQLFGIASQLRIGQVIRFSGMLFESGADCIREASMTLSGSIRKPEFIIRFQSIVAAE